MFTNTKNDADSLCNGYYQTRQHQPHTTRPNKISPQIKHNKNMAAFHEVCIDGMCLFVGLFVGLCVGLFVGLFLLRCVNVVVDGSILGVI